MKIVVLILCDSLSGYKFVAIYILCALCIQISVSIFVFRRDVLL
jgi:hypothetical protein